MPRKTMTISLPEAMQAYVLKQVELAGYSSASEYFRELVRTERQRQINHTQRINRMAEQEVLAHQPLASASRRYR